MITQLELCSQMTWEAYESAVALIVSFEYNYLIDSVRHFIIT